jgi:hypothetical protein
MLGLGNEEHIAILKGAGLHASLAGICGTAAGQEPLGCSASAFVGFEWIILGNGYEKFGLHFSAS